MTSKRATVPGLSSPFPMRDMVPSMLVDDPFACNMLDGLDEVIAPIMSVLDSFDAYLDPRTAPMDFVRYLGSWLLATLDDPWDEATVRRDVRLAAERSRTVGTAAGVRDRLVPHLARSVVLRDTGSTIASREPTDPLAWPDAPPPFLRVAVTRHADRPVDPELLERAVRDVIPAHVGLEFSAS